MNAQPASNEAPFRSVVVSREGAAIRVEKLELSDAARRRLTTNVKSLVSPGRYPAAGDARRK